LLIHFFFFFAIPVETLAVTNWVLRDLNKKWGQQAATKVLAIISSGHDAELNWDLKNKWPSEVKVRLMAKVPGSFGAARNAFGISQALTWVAGRRTEIQEELEWRTDVPELLELLTNPEKSLF
jgi:hypothetical protein